jgi:hypothetical protein
MKVSIKRRFARLWQVEHSATIKKHHYDTLSDLAYQQERPTAQLERSAKSWLKKSQAAIDKIVAGVRSGDYPKNAVELCSQELGYTGGDAADCFADIFRDVRAESECQTT